MKAKTEQIYCKMLDLWVIMLYKISAQKLDIYDNIPVTTQKNGVLVCIKATAKTQIKHNNVAIA